MNIQVCLVLLVSVCALSARSATSNTSTAAENASDKPAGKYSSLDCDWHFFEQPLSHFARGSTKGTYKQRLCVYNKFWEPNKDLPVLFYTGNESPVEEYVNNTGLIWELAPQLQAMVVFAEHRYFGESIPDINGVEKCMSYLTSEEALADYAALISNMRRAWGVGMNAAVVAFGGSYGGMLSSWLRILYPSVVDGAIAASAPVGGFPLDDTPLDASARAVSYATSAEAGCAKHCSSNLKKAWVLLQSLSASSSGLEVLSEQMNLCTRLRNERDMNQLREYLQAPLFDLAEGSYPFPTDYITYALTGSHTPLPAWAMQEVCKMIGESDYGILLENEVEAQDADVQFRIQSMDEATTIDIHVEWDSIQSTDSGQVNMNDVLQNTLAFDLLRDVAQSIQIWYNVTGDAPHCIDWSTNPAPNVSQTGTITPLPRRMRNTRNTVSSKKQKISDSITNYATTFDAFDPDGNGKLASPKGRDSLCTGEKEDITVATAWGSLSCNDGINLINTAVRGVGNDMYWPPNVPRNYTRKSVVESQFGYCKAFAAIGLYGIPDRTDDWAQWMDTLYGGKRLNSHSNIYYSNGDLDPWGPAGIPPSADEETIADGNIISRMIQNGGHHLDLFWPTDDDPQSVLDVRQEERKAILQWIDAKADYVKRMEL